MIEGEKPTSRVHCKCFQEDEQQSTQDFVLFRQKNIIGLTSTAV
jgi:hypothetical protein